MHNTHVIFIAYLAVLYLIYQIRFIFTQGATRNIRNLDQRPINCTINSIVYTPGLTGSICNNIL